MIDDVILNLKDEFLLAREENFAAFLGIQIKRNIDEGIVTLTQTDLKDRILEIMELEESSHKYTPTDLCTKILMIPHVQKSGIIAR